jgi:hypothetical protein
MSAHNTFLLEPANTSARVATCIVVGTNHTQNQASSKRVSLSTYACEKLAPFSRILLKFGSKSTNAAYLCT